MAQYDQTLLTRLNHIIDATAPEAGTVTTTEEFQAAMAKGRSQCIAARDTLRAASDAFDNDQIENRTVALKFDKTLEANVDEMNWLRGRAYGRWLDGLRSSERDALGEGELDRRQRVLAQVFSMTASRLQSIAVAKAHEFLIALPARLEPLPLSDEERAPFASLTQELATAHAALVAEKLDDEPRFQARRRARSEASRCAVSMRNLLAGVLGLDDSPLEVDEFILKRRSSDSPAQPSEPEPSVIEPSTPSEPLEP
ncbi:MAG: hypothetical protein AAFX99_04775 [Myxococcota bacterium]